MRVLLIEDDSATAQSIELMLKSENFNVYTTDLGEEGVDLGKLYDYDIILLDLNLPDMSGYEVLRTLRVAKVKTPILILSGLAGIEDKVKGLGFGADDYLTKPFHKDELVARIHAIVRRSKGHAQSVIATGDLIVNLDQKTVEVSGARVHLTGKEYQMLELLSLRKGTTLTKEMFLNHLYGGMDEPELKIIDVFICKLRKKLANASHGRNFIETVWGRGYVLREPREPDYRHPPCPDRLPPATAPAHYLDRGLCRWARRSQAGGGRVAPPSGEADGGHLGLQDLAVEGLHHVIVGPGVHGPGDMRDVVLGGTKDHFWFVAPRHLAQFLEEGVAVHDRHVPVEQDAVGHAGPADRERGLAVVGLLGFERQSLENPASDLADHARIIDHEHACHGTAPSERRLAASRQVAARKMTMSGNPLRSLEGPRPVRVGVRAASRPLTPHRGTRLRPLARASARPRSRSRRARCGPLPPCRLPGPRGR